MLKRSIKVTFRMNTREFQRLKTQVKKTGLSQEAFIRSLINGYMPKELPTLDYFYMMRELHAIGNNLNQLAAKANATGHIDKAVFRYEANRLRRAVQDIQEAVTSPERRESYGNNSNMGCNRPP